MTICIYDFFQLCREAGVPILNRDALSFPTGTPDIYLIRKEFNAEAPRWGTRDYFQQLSEKLADTIKLSQGDDLATSEPTDTTLAEYYWGTSGAPSPPGLIHPQQY